MFASPSNSSHVCLSESTLADGCPQQYGDLTLIMRQNLPVRLEISGNDSG